MIRMIRISKKYYLKQIVACWLMCYMALGIPAQVAMAIPVVIDDGGATVDQTIPNLTDVLVNQQETFMTWGNLNTTGAETVAFRDGALSGTKVLSDITGGKTQFDGHLTGEEGMALYFRNPAGWVFGPGSTVNVTQLLVTSLNIDVDDVFDGMPYTFTGGLDAGDVTNEGSITAERIALIAKNVINRGLILADECAIMAAGDRVLISENSPVTVEVSMPDGWVSDSGVHDIKNEDGEIKAERVVLAAGDIWSAALVTAYSDGGSDAVATIDIDAAGDVTVKNKVVAEAVGNGKNDAVATVTVNSGGDVDVIGDGGEALIQAKTSNGYTNTSDVLICADGYLTVEAKAWKDKYDIWHGGIASIEAIAQSGYNNDASVSIGAKEGINVLASGRLNRVSSEASIAAYAQYAENTNTASVVACTEGGVQVIDVGGGETPHTAKIVAEAKGGKFNTADVGICADCDADGDGDVVVAASEDGTAMIKAEAQAACEFSEDTDSTADAKVVVISKKGNVEVTGLSGGSARIEADARNAWTNKASVGVSAENVTVIAGGYGVGLPSDAGIYALARWGLENTATTVVCAPGEVAVVNLEGLYSGVDAGIGAVAWGGELDTATTQVYASDVLVSEGAYIGAIVPGDDKYIGGDTEFCLTEDGAVALTDGDSVLIIDDYSMATDCPDCPPCPCEEDEELLAPVAPLAQFTIPRIEGCPALTQAAAIELGITGETLQVAIGNALALNPTIQPCEACATLVNAANILRDEDGSRMAAMAQVFNTLAPADAPFTPEMATSIAMAFGGAAEGSQYASVMEYIDAFVQYAAVLDTELGSPVGDSVAFVMGKYGEDITGSDNGNIAAFVATRLEAIGM